MLPIVNVTMDDKGLMLKIGMVVDTTQIAVPSSTKNKDGGRDHEIHQTRKGNLSQFGIKTYIGVDAELGFVHTLVGAEANIHDVTQASQPTQGGEAVVFVEAG